MKLADLRFDYPEELVATQPQYPSRVMWVQDSIPSEISLSDLIQKIPAGDVLVINNTKVLKRRVFAGELEILFLSMLQDLEGGGQQWEVLFPSKKYALGSEIQLPEGLSIKLIQKGRPQIVESSTALTEEYFQRVAELPLPPYIQKARHERHNVTQDESWYQTQWASKPGSFAAPTASLHFREAELAQLKKKQVQLIEVTLHVGLGTFLPVTAEDLDQHDMHSEYVEISNENYQKILAAKKAGQKIWSLGTTATRALESVALGKITKNHNQDFVGFTNLLIQPGYEWQMVDRLLTNFHQPESTLLALVSAFSNLQTVKASYAWAMERKFRLFSYGDLSVWIK